MEDHNDDQSHYEISLTAGQAFVAFVLLLLSLAASFAFGLMLGKGQADERLVVRKDTPVIEAGVVPKKEQGRIVELGVDEGEFAAATATEVQAVTETAPPAEVVEEGIATSAADPALAGEAPPSASDPIPAPAASEQPPAKIHAVHYAQLLSTSDQKAAEALAARLINRGFTAAYVERSSSDRGPVFRVRVRFDSEADARAAEGRLKEFSKEVWITSR